MPASSDSTNSQALSDLQANLQQQLTKLHSLEQAVQQHLQQPAAAADVQHYVHSCQRTVHQLQGLKITSAYLTANQWKVLNNALTEWKLLQVAASLTASSNDNATAVSSTVPSSSTNQPPLSPHTIAMQLTSQPPTQSPLTAAYNALTTAVQHALQAYQAQVIASLRHVCTSSMLATHEWDWCKKRDLPPILLQKSRVTAASASIQALMVVLDGVHQHIRTSFATEHADVGVPLFTQALHATAASMSTVLYSIKASRFASRQYRVDACVLLRVIRLYVQKIEAATKCPTAEVKSVLQQLQTLCLRLAILCTTLSCPLTAVTPLLAPPNKRRNVSDSDVLRVVSKHLYALWQFDITPTDNPTELLSSLYDLTEDTVISSQFPLLLQALSDWMYNAQPSQSAERCQWIQQCVVHRHELCDNDYPELSAEEEKVVNDIRDALKQVEQHANQADSMVG